MSLSMRCLIALRATWFLGSRSQYPKCVSASQHERDAVAQKAMERMPHRRSAPVGHPLHPESERRRHEHADTMRNRFALGGNSAFILCVIMRLLYRKSI